ncbi:MAG: hypothetical protein HYY37_04740 [Candidatus Aenigmarchaeota archaeon]|nr:hypothetical protein [Candidatus Aenigmarchaeota archaeon]
MAHNRKQFLYGQLFFSLAVILLASVAFAQEETTTTTVPETTTTTAPPTTTTTVPETTTTTAAPTTTTTVPPATTTTTVPSTGDTTTTTVPPATTTTTVPVTGDTATTTTTVPSTTQTTTTTSAPPPQPGPSCPPPPQPRTCGQGQVPKPSFDSRGCHVDTFCEPVPQFHDCGNGICEQGENADNCQDDCGRKGAYCGDKRCDIGEDGVNCPQDCRSGPQCPDSITCPDGSKVGCFRSRDGCGCDQCPPPKGCREEKDPQSGFVKVICEEEIHRQCPPPEKELFDKCRKEGGTPVTKKDSSGCESFFCELGEERANPFERGKCPSPEEFRAIDEKCKKLDIPVMIRFEKGCKVIRCSAQEQRACPEVANPEFKKRLEEECRMKGLEIVKDFDPRGCPITRCGGFDDCARDVPKKAYQACKQDGGELVVERDEGGCVTFNECIHRGDDADISVEQIDEVPEPTELLAIAFKLENLRISLDKLARQTDEIADYYKSTNSPEEEKFRRVSDMFAAAKDKVNEIKRKLSDRLEDLTVDDIMEVKHDIRYIKDIVIKDIVYLMLSTDEDVKELTTSVREAKTKGTAAPKDCGTDGGCFERSFRVCKPVRFRPEGSDGPVLEVTGLEGNACIVKAELPEETGPPAGFIPGVEPPYVMTCTFDKYAFGMPRGDPKEFIPQYCTGSFAEIMKWCNNNPGMCPDDGGGRNAGGPGGCRSEEECSEYCSDPENFEECRNFGSQQSSSSRGSSRTTSRATPEDFGDEEFGPQQRFNEPDSPQQFNQPPQQFNQPQQQFNQPPQQQFGQPGQQQFNQPPQQQFSQPGPQQQFSGGGF